MIALFGTYDDEDACGELDYSSFVASVMHEGEVSDRHSSMASTRCAHAVMLWHHSHVLDPEV